MARTGNWSRRDQVGLAILGLALVLAVSAWFWAQRGIPPGKVEESRTLVPRPVALASGVYLLGKSSPSAVYAVETSEGLVLIDSGVEAHARGVTNQLAEMRLDVNRLRAILLTHVHGDHSLGAAHLREMTGAKVYAGRADCAPLRDGGPREAFFSSFQMPDIHLHPTPVDVELTGDETIDVGDTRFTALACPGHTPGSICYLMERLGRRVLFTGDVIQCLRPTKQGDLGTYAAYLPALYRGNARDYLATLRRLRVMAVPDLLLPGHPRMDPAPEDPRLTPDRWHALLDQGIDEMEKLLARVAADGPDFLDGVPKELVPGLHYLGQFQHTALYCLITSKGLFLFDAPGGPGLVDFLAARLQQIGLTERPPIVVLLTSTDDHATAGLEELVRRTSCKVVAPNEGVVSLRGVCPPNTLIVTAGDLPTCSQVDVRMIRVKGLTHPAAAYRMRLGTKTVLVTGVAPVSATFPAIAQLQRDVASPGGDPMELLKSLDELSLVAPDLWLPARPFHGQNANLYDHDWVNVLTQNRRLFRSINLSSSAAPLGERTP